MPQNEAKSDRRAVPGLLLGRHFCEVTASRLLPLSESTANR